MYLGVIGEKTVRQAGQMADGWLPAFYSPEHAQELNQPLRLMASRRLVGYAAT